ncbi:mRNA 3'-end-processing protein rna14 [Coemansia sp. RSA 1813]|nr:mRNA 3'-end-processing protein rna14 [Coemansia sp. RSA 1646]KAJ1773178.1 mRNA 3'-end-processing protein rna14 [Coemansia sp. RSA 1843]KAJ2092055.1 mRNA 3'-end-processing protein rna14 [Coemansia sp. RSA 986]KAJ2216609.1 mRNA 3'-end-processing protein rna14 [Coemansia sp. RSA 487]KAJ2572108.1 mRNA 3'-end-processing protein rna14 [Coemansia sp. RSA 1813]
MADSMPNTSSEEHHAVHQAQQHPSQQQAHESQSTGIPEADAYKQRLNRSPYDADAWFGLLRVSKNAGDDRLVAETYDEALKQYPSSGHFLAGFAELELSRGNRESAESIFNSKLFNVPSIELWKCYLGYVLKSNANEQGMVVHPESRATVNDCYKLVLENVGLDREAGQIWINYIAFLASAQTHAPYEDQQKQDSLREAYQAAVIIPMLKVEDIWRDYDAFEAQIDRSMAKQTLSKVSPAYTAARIALREMNKHYDNINKSQPPHGLPIPPGWTPRETEHLNAWREYLKWEVSNPLHVEDESVLQQRVVYAYNQACMCLRLYPEIWIEFAEYLLSLGQPNEALTKLQQASQMLPNSLSVQFAYAEAAEKQKQTDVCKEVYEKLVERTRGDIDSTNTRYAQKLEKLDKHIKALDVAKAEEGDGKNATNNSSRSAAIINALSMDTDSDEDTDDDNSEDNDSIVSNADFDYSDMQGDESGLNAATKLQISQMKKKIEKRVERAKVRMERELEEKREIYTLSWIMYLRFIQRSEGIDAVRQLLRRPRSDPSGYVTYHLFVAAALMEYHVAKRPGIAAKLFEYYAKTYSDSQEYIVEYMNYLINSGDDTNARALFERFQSTSIGDTSDMWTLFSDFEYNYGDMGAISKLDKRYIEKFDNESILTRMAARYSYLNMDYVPVSEFGFPYRKDIIRDDPHAYGAARRYGAEHDALHSGEATEYSRSAGGGPDAAAEQLASISVGSVTGRFLAKSQLLMPVTSGRFAKPNFAEMEEYNPDIEPFVPSEPLSSAGDGYAMHPGAGHSGAKPYAHHLDNGDVLSYVAASVAASDTSEFDSSSINVDTLLSAIMQLPQSNSSAQSHYRPLMYMPWLNRVDHYNSHYRGDRPPSRGSYGQPRSRSRGRTGYGDSDGGGHRSYSGHPARNFSRGAYSHRQPPYARTTGYHSGGSRSYGRGGSNQGYALRDSDRGSFR